MNRCEDAAEALGTRHLALGEEAGDVAVGGVIGSVACGD